MNPILGLAGIVGIWLSMAMMPLAELLALSPTQATLIRGASGLICIGILAKLKRGLVTKPDKNTLIIVACFVVATLCLFQAITAWGSNFSALFLDMAVIVPIVLAWRRKELFSAKVYVTFIVAIFGTMLALQVFSNHSFNWIGFGWSIGALTANGLFIENAGKAKQKNWNKAFWMSVGLVLAGLPALGEAVASTSYELSAIAWVGLLVLFSVTTGVLNFYSSFIAIANLSPVSVGILVLGVTPTIILSSYLILGKTMSVVQLVGVGVTLLATLMFGNLQRQKK